MQCSHESLNILEAPKIETFHVEFAHMILCTLRPIAELGREAAYTLRSALTFDGLSAPRFGSSLTQIRVVSTNQCCFLARFTILRLHISKLAYG